MIKYISILLVLLVPLSSFAHEMTPTYPKWRISSYEGLLVTEMEMFNKRYDVEYYEIAVLDEEWNPIPFVSSYKIFKLDYLGKINFEIYIREQDKDKVEYVCSRSKMRDKKAPGITSMICSRFE